MSKMNFNRRALAITAVPTTLTSRFPITGYARVLFFIMYRTRARRNWYSMFISVYILWIRFSVDLSARIALGMYFQRTVFLFKFGSLDGHFLM